MGYFFGIVKNSAVKINKVLGNHDGSDDYKTQRNWWSQMPDGTMFSVYDYCAYRKIKANESYDYHIGTLNEEDTKKVIKYLKKLGLNAKFDK